MVVSGIDGGAQLAREHQRRDARDVRLERDHLQVHQQLEVLVERRRHADSARRAGVASSRADASAR